MSSLGPDTNKLPFLIGPTNTLINAKLAGYSLRFFKALCIAIACLSLIFITNVSNAETTVTTQNTSQLNQNNDANSDPDPQVAPSPDTPFNDTGTANGTDSVAGFAVNNSPDALTNPNSLASQMHPSDTALSEANQQLLSQNAQLRRDVNSLKTQVNVLANEHSGQLFMYGAITVTIALFLGFLLSWFIFGRRERW